MSNEPTEHSDLEDFSADVEVDLGQGDYVSADDEVDLDLGTGQSYASDDDSELNLDFGTASTEEPADDDDLNLDFAPAEEAAEEDEESSDDVDDDVAAKARAELRAELEGKFGEWYVIHTYSGMENRVQQNLENRATSLNMEDYIFEVRVPTEEITEIRNGVKKNVKRTVLPGYVLVRMDLTDQSWTVVRQTPSVTGFVGHSNQPIPLSLDEVENMLAPSVVAAAVAASGDGPSKPTKKKKIEVADFAEGDSVMVVEGVFAGIHATITEINVLNQRVKALVEIMGRETPVELTFAQVQKV